MSNAFNGDEEVLARLLREAGDPNVSPDPQYAETLRAAILGRLGPAETAAQAKEVVRKADVNPVDVERTRKMKRIAKFALAATILAALAIPVAWMAIGASSNIAYARVADALDSLRSATYDLISEAKGENGEPRATAAGKGFFLAPSHQRMEISTELAPNPAAQAAAEAARRHHVAGSPAAKAAAEAAAKAAAQAIALMPKITQVTIADSQAGKAVMLMPSLKIAVEMDMKKYNEDTKKSAKEVPPDVFETVRRLVRKGSSGAGEKAEKLGKKEIDGHAAVGFHSHTEIGDMIVWADPATARPVRIELANDILAGVHMTISNFRYDVDLDPSLFSLKPPEGYAVQAWEVTMPVEEDLLGTLRTIAENNKGAFPAKLVINEEVMKALMAGTTSMPVMDKPTMEKLEAEANKVLAKYGGKEKLKAKYGKDIPPDIMAELMKSGMAIMQEQMQEQMQKQSQKQMPLMQKRTQGIAFYAMLKPENDPHYVGGGVKLGTPDRPILWYKPTGAEKYRVVYADLSVKEMTPGEVKKLPQARAK